MASENPVLLVASTQRGHEMAARLRTLGLKPLFAGSWAAAEQVIGDATELVTAALVDLSITGNDLKPSLKRLRRVGPTIGITFVAFGEAPDRAQRKRLRSAGVRLGLWEPIDEGLLRFQMNRALNGEREEHGRRKPRVPTALAARVHGGGRTKDALVYSLSETGAFLETPRASMDGARIEVEIRLPGELIVLPAEVAFSNVPGNLQRPNLPLGMGVHFGELARDQRKCLADFVGGRLAQLVL